LIEENEGCKEKEGCEENEGVVDREEYRSSFYG
jgi:hypothetical protein